MSCCCGWSDERMTRGREPEADIHIPLGHACWGRLEGRSIYHPGPEPLEDCVEDADEHRLRRQERRSLREMRETRERYYHL
jgi:hypothetical protein